MKTAALVLLCLALSGCVTQLPHGASPDFYRDYNRARYGNPDAVPVFSR